jgi:hypothetical protein
LKAAQIAEREANEAEAKASTAAGVAEKADAAASLKAKKVHELRGRRELDMPSSEGRDVPAAAPATSKVPVGTTEKVVANAAKESTVPSVTAASVSAAEAELEAAQNKATVARQTVQALDRCCLSCAQRGARSTQSCHAVVGEPASFFRIRGTQGSRCQSSCAWRIACRLGAFAFD